jgi:hypothetical protein
LPPAPLAVPAAGAAPASAQAAAATSLPSSTSASAEPVHLPTDSWSEGGCGSSCLSAPPSHGSFRLTVLLLLFPAPPYTK